MANIRREKIRNGAVNVKKFPNAYVDGRYFIDRFHDPIRTWLASDTSTVPTGTAGTENILFTGKHSFRFTVLGDNTTVLSPVDTTNGGIDLGMDQTLADGAEYNFGSVTAGHPRNTTSGSEDAFFRAYFSLQNASGVDLFLGLRKIEATQTALATFTDLAGIRILGDSSSAAGAISIVTNLNDATDLTSTDTTQTVADAASIELEVRIKSNRYAEFLIDGVETTVKVTDFQFDSGDELCPVIYLLNTTDLTGEVNLRAVEGGPIDARRSGTLL